MVCGAVSPAGRARRNGAYGWFVSFTVTRTRRGRDAFLRIEERNVKCGRRWRGSVHAVGVLLAASAVLPGSLSAQMGCPSLTFDGEVQAGHSFQHRIDSGQIFLLESLPSGWIVRVLPAAGARPMHDYAELATPPYRSPNPLLISTDFAFRSQDAISWNPREFHFFTTAAQMSVAGKAYEATVREPNRPVCWCGTLSPAGAGMHGEPEDSRCAHRRRHRGPDSGGGDGGCALCADGAYARNNFLAHKARPHRLHALPCHISGQRQRFAAPLMFENRSLTVMQSMKDGSTWRKTRQMQEMAERAGME